MNNMNEMPGANIQMSSTFFTDATGWGDVLFPGFHTNNYGQFFGLLIFSFLQGFFTTRYVKIIPPEGNIFYFLFYSGKSAMYFVCMNLAMTMNVWVFLAVCLGQGAGHLKKKLKPQTSECKQETSECNLETCECNPETCEC